MPTAATDRAARIGAASTILVLLVTLVGCSNAHGGAAPHTTPSSSSSASVTPSSAASTAASPSAGSQSPPPAPPFSTGPAGERAFARHVIDLWAYGLRTDDARPLTSLAAPHRPCGGCAAFASSMRQRDQQAWSVDLPSVVVHTVALKRAGSDKVATATIDIPQSDSYFRNGSFRNSNPAHPGAHFTVRLRTAGKSYRLVAFTIS